MICNLFGLNIFDFEDVGAESLALKSPGAVALGFRGTETRGDGAIFRKVQSNMGFAGEEAPDQQNDPFALRIGKLACDGVSLFDGDWYVPNGIIR